MELESLCAWLAASDPQKNGDILVRAVAFHIEAAREAAKVVELNPRRRLHLLRYGPLRERAMSNLDAAEAHLLNLAPAWYLLGQMPSLLQHVRSHLLQNDPRRREMERICHQLGLDDGGQAPVPALERACVEQCVETVEQSRGQIVAATRAASSASLREQVQVRSFRNVLVVTTVTLTLLLITTAVLAWRSPTLLPLCFAPEQGGQAVVVCPTQQSAPFVTSSSGPGAPRADTATDIDNATAATAKPWDLLVVQLVGLTAAAVAAAGAIRNILGSSERYGIPVALAALKLPTGAATAFLGLVLMRGQFVPGLSALDTSAQILAWALVFGYAQQVFTRLVDRQGQVVLNNVRGADERQASRP
jgi:hypothetical protein